MIETWLWEREQSHRLFNFHEGYRKLEGSINGEHEVIGSHIIQKNGPNDILFLQASEYKEHQESQRQDTRDDKKLLNIVYHEHKYYLYEPKNQNETEDNIIDNHLWLIMKFMPRRRHQIYLDDVIRFGRIPFKVTKIVLDAKDELKSLKEHKKKNMQLSTHSMVDLEQSDSNLMAHPSA